MSAWCRWSQFHALCLSPVRPSSEIRFVNSLLLPGRPACSQMGLNISKPVRVVPSRQRANCVRAGAPLIARSHLNPRIDVEVYGLFLASACA